MNNKKQSLSENCYFSCRDNPEGRKITYELWEDEHPEKVIAGQKLEKANYLTFSKEQMDKMVVFWKQLAEEEQLKKPIITIQVDIGGGASFMYFYNNGSKKIPPNAKYYVKKPIFDKNIVTVRCTDNPGKSMIYQNYLDSPNMSEEISNFNKLLPSFFEGKFGELFRKYAVNKNDDVVFISYFVVNNKKLKK